MKKLTILPSLLGVFIACSGSSPQSINDPSPTNPLPNSSPDASFDASIKDSGVAEVMDVQIPSSCIQETDTSFCSRYSILCGAEIGTDNCGFPRTVSNCGTCKATEFCNSGSCSLSPCIPETDANLCTTANKDCGVASLVNNCGSLINAVCGPSDCGKGSNCVANKCVLCVPKVCAPGSCGLINDGCNPAPLDCLSCGGNNVCAGNVCVSPACVPESDHSFCIRTASNCGTVIANDNCGKSRTVSSCGTLVFNNGSGIFINGGIPPEIANGKLAYIEGWINPTSDTGGIVHLGDDNKSVGGTFWLDISGGLLSMVGQTTSIGPNPTTISIPLNTFTFVFAYIDGGGEGYMGKVVDNVFTRQQMKTDFLGSNLMSGGVSTIGAGFTGQINNVRIRSTIPLDADTLSHYHNCIPGEPGLIRQWCMGEGSGATTSDNILGSPSPLNGSNWKTGSCK